MAQKRKHHRRHARHLANAHRKHRRHGRRRYHHNAPSGAIKDALMAGLAVVAGVAAVRKGGELIARWLPASVPQPQLVSEAAAALIAGVVAVKAVKNPKIEAGALGGIAGALIMTGINMTSAGQMLGLEKVVMLPAPKPADGNVSAALEAALEAEVDRSEY